MNNVQLRVGDLLYAAFKRWKMILALGLLGFICGFALSGVSYLQGNYTSYEISCSIAITSQSSTGAFTNNSSYLSTNDFHLAEDMVDAASFVMKSNRVLQAALDSTGLVSVSTKDVYQNLEVSRYNETQVLQLTLSWNNADAGIRLMNAILDASRTILPETLMAITTALGLTSGDYRRLVANSFLLSCDNGHARHPNHPELADANEAPVLNGGVVVKHSPRYATDAVSAAAFQEICRRAQVPTQHYANRPDQAGGATLGNIANTKLPVNTVDIGMAQLAMHSCFETMGSRDVAHFVRAVTACYEAALTFTDTQVTLG